ncbi:MAG TPA: hypothetical protein VJ783_16895 [Pirellulales bacterium]|nr:hypothetical protein [Pirellulales bacterium]
MIRWFQFSLRTLLVATAIISAFLAGDLHGRKREGDRLIRIKDVHEEIQGIIQVYERDPMPPEIRRKVEGLYEERAALGWTLVIPVENDLPPLRQESP